jgi:hypothetical protein
MSVLDPVLVRQNYGTDMRHRHKSRIWAVRHTTVTSSGTDWASFETQSVLHVVCIRLMNIHSRYCMVYISGPLPVIDGNMHGVHASESRADKH